MSIKLENIKKSYSIGKTEINVLKGISLNINSGEFLSIMGPSGSGKSTLLNILGLLDKSDQGHFFIEGNNVDSLGKEELAVLRRSFIGFVFQSFNLIPRLSVFENVELPLIYSNVDKNKRKQLVTKKLEDVGLASKIYNKSNELSGGERQRVAIARALINSPSILIADEPTGNLDSKTGKEVMNLLKELNQQGITIILVTHDQKIAEYGDRIIYLKDGSIESCSQINLEVNKVVKKKSKWIQNNQVISGLKIIESIKLALGSIRVNKLRSFLMLLGMIVAVFSLIISVAIGDAGKKKISQEIATFGTNTIWVKRDYSDRKRKGELDFFDSKNEINNFDIKYIEKHNSDSIKYITPKLNFPMKIKYKNLNEEAYLIGTTPTYKKTGNETLKFGRFINHHDIDNHHKVCVLSWTAYKKLGKAEDILNEYIQLGRERFRVVGVFDDKNTSILEMIGRLSRDRIDIFIPLSIAQRIKKTDNVSYIEAQVINFNRSREIAKHIVNSLTKLHRNRSKFNYETLARYVSSSKIILGTVSLIIGAFASISLFVGGLGITNIMLVSISERTKEIGIRKAIGATSKDILLQFLIESATIGIVGGGIGIILGLFGIFLIQIATKIDNLFSMPAITIAFSSSMLVGVIAGVYPARNASKLEPADTLRYE
ncbi:MAG: hypothetical protein CMP21_08710 [Rickettsiales bacterium]|nr:hypothetical protein [Rickettsiales bacterium]|tara:strand:- start:7538 stop:9508 length:1971 start_codon:yes stop_codon:yes gene_type:complete